MCFDGPLITASQGGDGTGFGRRQREVVEHASVCRIPLGSVFIHLAPDILTALRQRFPVLQMMVLTQREELIATHIAAQSECFSAFAEPLTANPLPFAVIVACAKMLLKILLSILQVVLRLR